MAVVAKNILLLLQVARNALSQVITPKATDVSVPSKEGSPHAQCFGNRWHPEESQAF